jgi:hypothetical protein
MNLASAATLPRRYCTLLAMHLIRGDLDEDDLAAAAN